MVDQIQPNNSDRKPRKSRKVKPLKPHLAEMINQIVEFSELAPDDWILMAGDMCEAEIPPAKHGALKRLLSVMDASERMTALTLMPLVKHRKISEAFIDCAMRNHSLPMIAAVMVVE